MALRNGFTIVELVVTLILLGVLMSTAVALLAQVGRGQRDIDQRQIALYETDSLLEELAALPWDDLNDDTASTIELSDDCRAALRDPQLTVTIAAESADQAGSPPARRLTVELRWTDRFGNQPPPVRLSAWRHDVRRTLEEPSEP